MALLALAAPLALEAQDSISYKNHLYDTFQASVNFTTVVNRSKARVDGSSGILGTTLDFRDILGLSGTTFQPALSVRWKPGRHTELDAGVQFINQSGQRDFMDTLRVGDDTVSGAISATTKAGSSNAILAFKYTLWAAERHALGLEIGLGAAFFSLKMDATGTACGGPNCAGGTLNVDKSLTGPVGGIGAFGQWRLGNRWYLGVDARGIGAKVDRYDFSVFQGDVAAEYFLSDRWGLTGGWYYNNVTVKVEPKSGGSVANDLVGEVVYSYSSLRLGLLGVF